MYIEMDKKYHFEVANQKTGKASNDACHENGSKKGE